MPPQSCNPRQTLHHVVKCSCTMPSLQAWYAPLHGHNASHGGECLLLSFSHLHCCAQSYCLVWVHFQAHRLQAHHVVDERVHARHARGATHQQHLADGLTASGTDLKLQLHMGRHSQVSAVAGADNVLQACTVGLWPDIFRACRKSQGLLVSSCQLTPYQMPANYSA